MPNPELELSSPTYMTGVSPVVSVNKAMFDDVGAEGLKEPAAYTPEDMSGEKAREEMIPVTKNGPRSRRK